VARSFQLPTSRRTCDSIDGTDLAHVESSMIHPLAPEIANGVHSGEFWFRRSEINRWGSGTQRISRQAPGRAA